MGAISNIRNFVSGVFTGDKNATKNVNNYRGLAQLQRFKVDVNYWREGISELERPYYPYRVKVQTVFKDTQLNGHVAACLERRYTLTLLRDFKLCDESGKENEQWTKYFKKQWFYKYLRYVLEAEQYGYSLISLGDYIKDDFPYLTVCTRENISPDREIFSKFPYTPSGLEFTKKPYDNWHIWVTTPSDNGITPCGYGLLYKVAYYEILIRNNMGNNANYNQLFGMPIRWIKTAKGNEDEVKELQSYLENMASQSYLITDLTEELNLVETKGTGKGSDTFGALEKRCMDIISKLELGHANALDEQSGKLGAGQGEDNPVRKALEDIQVKDGRLVEAVTNTQLLVKLRNIGIPIPTNLHFEFNNDNEVEGYRRRQDESNKVTAEIAQTMKNAGLKMDAKYFEERTGIKTTEAEIIAPVVAAPPPKGMGKQVQDRLKKIYNKHTH